MRLLSKKSDSEEKNSNTIPQNLNQIKIYQIIKTKLSQRGSVDFQENNFLLKFTSYYL